MVNRFQEMKLIIDIDKQTFDKLTEYGEPLSAGNGFHDSILKAVANGKPIEALKEERPQGEWTEKVEHRGCFAGDKTVYSYTCPFCGAKEFKKYPFCHCGADLRGGANND